MPTSGLGGRESGLGIQRRGWDSNPRAALRRLPVFKTGAFNRSATPPGSSSRPDARRKGGGRSAPAVIGWGDAPGADTRLLDGPVRRRLLLGDRAAASRLHLRSGAEQGRSGDPLGLSTRPGHPVRLAAGGADVDQPLRTTPLRRSPGCSHLGVVTLLFGFLKNIGLPARPGALHRRAPPTIWSGRELTWLITTATPRTSAGQVMGAPRSAALSPARCWGRRWARFAASVGTEVVFGAVLVFALALAFIASRRPTLSSARNAAAARGGDLELP